MVRRIRSKYNVDLDVNSMDNEVELSGQHRRAETDVTVNTMTAEILEIKIAPVTYFIFLDNSFVVNNDNNYLLGVGEFD